MGVASIDQLKDTTVCLSPKIYQPSTESMETFMDSPRKKKMFSSSSFYEEPNAIYPTVEEQVELCRKIADSLSDECNLKSKGANMFFKRVKKAEKWIVAESSVESDGETMTDSGATDPSKMPYVRPLGLGKLKLILDPRHLVDMKRLLKEGVDIVEHNAVSPEICHDLVKDLNSPTGKGAQLFAKRKKKSVEWVVDEEKVKALLRERQGYSSPELQEEWPTHTRRNLTQNQLDSFEVAETVIKAAEAKIMTYPAPQMPVLECFSQINKSPNNFQQKRSLVKSPTFPSLNSEAYKYRAPKGWTSSSISTPISASGLSSTTNSIPAYVPEESNGRLSVTFSSSHQLPPSSSPIPRTFNFTNFNSSPRAWNPAASNQLQSFYIKPVKPPVLVQ